jgi:hypothetical protein
VVTEDELKNLGVSFKDDKKETTETQELNP